MLAVKESEDKIEEAGGDSLKQLNKAKRQKNFLQKKELSRRPSHIPE